RRGGTAGLHVTGISAEDDALLAADAGMLVFEIGSGDPDRQAFELKRALSLVRGRRPAAKLLIAAPPEPSAALRARGLEAYVDRFLPTARPIRAPEELLTPGSDLDSFAGARLVPPQKSRSDPGVVWLLPADPK